MPLSQDNQIISQNLSWLPTGVWPEVDELRTEHARLLEGMREAYAEARAVATKYEAEDEAVSAALKEGYRSDTPATPPHTTPLGKREAERGRVNKCALAARDALWDFMEETFERIRELAPDLYARMEEIESAAQAAQAEAERALEVAMSTQRGLVPLRGWLSHEVSDIPGWRVPFGSLGTPDAPVELDLRNLVGSGFPVA